jgi:hypothetical protein
VRVFVNKIFIWPFLCWRLDFSERVVVLVFVVVAIGTTRLLIYQYFRRIPSRSHASDIENNVNGIRCSILHVDIAALHVQFFESFTCMVRTTRVRVGATLYYAVFLVFWVLELSPLCCGMSVSVMLSGRYLSSPIACSSSEGKTISVRWVQVGCT